MTSTERVKKHQRIARFEREIISHHVQRIPTEDGIRWELKLELTPRGREMLEDFGRANGLTVDAVISSLLKRRVVGLTPALQ